MVVLVLVRQHHVDAAAAVAEEHAGVMLGSLELGILDIVKRYRLKFYAKTVL